MITQKSTSLLVDCKFINSQSAQWYRTVSNKIQRKVLGFINLKGALHSNPMCTFLIVE